MVFIGFISRFLEIGNSYSDKIVNDLLVRRFFIESNTLVVQVIIK